jgi:hypothetical protein
MPNFLVFALFQNLGIKRDFVNIFYIALFRIRIKRDSTVLYNGWVIENELLQRMSEEAVVI